MNPKTPGKGVWWTFLELDGGSVLVMIESGVVKHLGIGTRELSD